MPQLTQSHNASIPLTLTDFSLPLTFPQFNITSGADLVGVHLKVRWLGWNKVDAQNVGPGDSQIRAEIENTVQVLRPDNSELFGDAQTSTINATVPPNTTLTSETNSIGTEVVTSGDDELEIPPFIGSGNITFTAKMSVLVSDFGTTNGTHSFASKASFDATLTYVYNT